MRSIYEVRTGSCSELWLLSSKAHDSCETERCIRVEVVVVLWLVWGLDRRRERFLEGAAEGAVFIIRNDRAATGSVAMVV